MSLHFQGTHRPALCWIAHLIALGLFVASASQTVAADYFLDPVNGSLANAGTRQSPWPSLEAVGASGRQFAAGDRLILLAGYHGSPVLKTTNPGEVLVLPDTGARVTAKSIIIQSARHWRVRGLELSPSLAPVFERVTIAAISGGSDNVIEDCLIYTALDTSGWTVADWDTRTCNGISLSGTNNTASGNVLRYVNFGIITASSGSHNIVRGNTIEDFMSDGLRGLGEYCVFEYNTVKNCYRINTNHDDGFQSWSIGPGGAGTGTIRGVVLRGNRFINYSNPDQFERGTMQGIGCFDGFYEDWVIENNVIITDHFNGITFLGAKNCRIVNNTVIDINSTSPGPPWIKVAAHKDGRPSTGNIIRNNLTTDLRIDTGAGTVDHNLKISTLATHFVDAAAHDLRLRPGSPAIDGGSPDLAPTRDIDQVARPSDGNDDGVPKWDIGAHEFVGANSIPAVPGPLEVQQPAL